MQDGELKEPTLVHFFCLDTNGCQRSVRVQYPTSQADLYRYKEELALKLAASPAKWKIVFGHHPMYTQGLWHGLLGKCLRDHKYFDASGVERDGYGLEDMFVELGVDAYITGHEHRMVRY